MKRRIALLALGLIASPLALIATPSPASAHPGVCAGTGVLLTPSLYYFLPAPVGGGSASGSVSGQLGVCVHGSDVAVTATVSGSVTGHCGRSNGSVTVNGHTSAFTTAGSVVVVLPGQAAGLANAVPALGHSCLGTGPGASQFQVTGAVVLLP